MNAVVAVVAPNCFCSFSKAADLSLMPMSAVVDAQLLGPHFSCATFAATEERQLQARLLQQAEAKSITNVKALLQQAVGVEPKAAVGEHSIHIHHQQVDAA